MVHSNDLESEDSKTGRASWTAWQTILTGFNILNHVLIVIVTIYMTCLTYNAINDRGNAIKMWHPLLCTVGYQVMMTQSILAFYSQNVWSKNYHRQTQRTLHWVLQAIGSSMAMVGIVLEYVSRERSGKVHFKFGHGLMGLIAGILTLISMLGGVSALWSVYFKRYIKPVYLKLAHNLNGIAAFVCGMVTLFLGYDIKFMKQNSREDIRMWLQAFCVITTILTLLGAARAALRHTQNVCSMFIK